MAESTGSSEPIENEIDDNKPISAQVSGRGIKTSADFADFMVALMDDVVCGRVAPGIATAACKAADSLLDVVKLQLNQTGSRVPLRLSGQRIGETEQKRLSGPCESCGFPFNSDQHMKQCGRGMDES